MKVYDPRLDTSPGAHQSDPAYHVDTKNPALWLAALSNADQVDWAAIVDQANHCEELVRAPMTEARAREILGSILNADQLPSGFFSEPHEQEIDEDVTPKARLDGRFTADHLEAIAWWMRNKGKR